VNLSLNCDRTELHTTKTALITAEEIGKDLIDFRYDLASPFVSGCSSFRLWFAELAKIVCSDPLRQNVELKG
jgi:hypothetical protein